MSDQVPPIPAEQPSFAVGESNPALLPTSGKAIASLVLGILAIPSCLFYGLPSFILRGLAIMFNRHAVTEIDAGLRNPSSRGLAKAGMICGIVGIGLGALYLILIIIAVVAATAIN